MKRRSAGNLEHKDQALISTKCKTHAGAFQRRRGDVIIGKQLPCGETYKKRKATGKPGNSLLSLSLSVHHQRDVSINEGEGEELDAVHFLAGR